MRAAAAVVAELYMQASREIFSSCSMDAAAAAAASDKLIDE